MSKVKIRNRDKEKFRELRRLSLEQVIKDQKSYQRDLLFFYNMTQEEADNYYKELKFNESLIKDKVSGRK